MPIGRLKKKTAQPPSYPPILPSNHSEGKLVFQEHKVPVVSGNASIAKMSSNAAEDANSADIKTAPGKFKVSRTHWNEEKFSLLAICMEYVLRKYGPIDYEAIAQTMGTSGEIVTATSIKSRLHTIRQKRIKDLKPVPLALFNRGGKLNTFDGIEIPQEAEAAEEYIKSKRSMHRKKRSYKLIINKSDTDSDSISVGEGHNEMDEDMDDSIDEETSLTKRRSTAFDDEPAKKRKSQSSESSTDSHRRILKIKLPPAKLNAVRIERNPYKLPHPVVGSMNPEPEKPAASMQSPYGFSDPRDERNPSEFSDAWANVSFNPYSEPVLAGRMIAPGPEGYQYSMVGAIFPGVPQAGVIMQPTYGIASPVNEPDYAGTEAPHNRPIPGAACTHRQCLCSNQLLSTEAVHYVLQSGALPNDVAFESLPTHAKPAVSFDDFLNFRGDGNDDAMGDHGYDETGLFLDTSLAITAPLAHIEPGQVVNFVRPFGYISNNHCSMYNNQYIPTPTPAIPDDGNVALSPTETGSSSPTANYNMVDQEERPFAGFEFPFSEVKGEDYVLLPRPYDDII